jgi:hypothetical protein
VLPYWSFKHETDVPFALEKTILRDRGLVDQLIFQTMSRISRKPTSLNMRGRTFNVQMFTQKRALDK